MFCFGLRKVIKIVQMLFHDNELNLVSKRMYRKTPNQSSAMKAGSRTERGGKTP